MNEDDPTRIGIIGAGAISQIVHLPIFVERHDVEVVALADTDVHKAETLSRRYGVPIVLDAEELLALDEIDAVVVCTPNHLHEEMAVEALGAGKHVLVERPLATTSEGAARVIEAAKASERVLSVGLPHRFRPEVIALRSFVLGEQMGDLYAVRASWLTRSTPMARSTWRHDPNIAGGGALIDLGIPALDLCMWTIDFPTVKRVTCVLAGPDAGVEYSATLFMETEEGLAITVEVSNRLFAGEDRYYMRVMGDDGSGSLPPLEIYKQVGGRPMDVTPRQPKPRGGENPYTNAYRRLLDDFVRQITGLRDVSLPVHQVGLMALIEAAYRSAKEGREVEL
ncbi:MAG: Gfo/Idh/MocA family oxidoreductase [Gemmatimonadota bacterium]|nr:Gfo/Idh/MocA family oxidoreductase [Gemmatimonadota bacterium]MDH3424969.1 Gfo/Idh/MocA family oxidoreductase [Gemmatimonadota bacterium]